MYIQPSADLWRGRIDSDNDPLSFRYHQQVQTVNSSDISPSNEQANRFAIIGFQCDEGVRRNKGRVGAAEGPEAIRKAVAKLPWHFKPGTQVLDIGDVKCDGNQMEAAQEEMGAAISTLHKKGIFPLILGGGHETFYGHYLGARKYLGPDAKIGIVNIDAHFDLRPYDQEPSSGTMFKQILDQDPNSRYMVIGIQTQGNTKTLFETARKLNVQYILEDSLSIDRLDEPKKEISKFAREHDAIILTLCTDGISSAFAPGVSAPSPFGLEPKLVRALIRHIVSHDNILSFDISEVNPSLDEENKTVSLAASLVNDALLTIDTKHKMEGTT
ncbi:formimidoylglutamase [Neobacillus mesonae]|uniref:formimidoylglutamase n=1 Tax=Neobacillus mesonae TaxID=1193713 RepID=UPI00203EBE2E|nr:formimidoylglutamase [Neobacillus mesonae]MCM3568448.1 formimidoylglutamase [Neobacillus mesonae]